MKKLHSFAFYALVTPVITLGAGSLLAEQSTDLEIDHEQQSTQRDQNGKQSTQGEQRSQHANQPDSHGQNMRDQDHMQHRGYMSAAPANGTQASDLLGADVKTTDGEDVGPVDDLIIDKNGKVVAILVGVGGFLGMAEKDVAIGWDDVTRSGTSDEQELRIKATREDLQSAPEFETRD